VQSAYTPPGESGKGTVGWCGRNGSMSNDAGGLSVRQSPRKRAADARVGDFTLLMRVPGGPDAVRVFTDEEAEEEVAQYAAGAGGVAASALATPGSSRRLTGR
jgi:hypothetical protein